jgi:hypothetical protein
MILIILFGNYVNLSPTMQSTKSFSSVVFIYDIGLTFIFLNGSSSSAAITAYGQSSLSIDILSLEYISFVPSSVYTVISSYPSNISFNFALNFSPLIFSFKTTSFITILQLTVLFKSSNF